MNILESAKITSPYDKAEECAKFMIDDTTQPFIFSELTYPTEEYTFSCWIKSDADASITAEGVTMQTSSAWKRGIITFTSDSRDFLLFFDAVGTYYLYHSQMEKGNKATDWIAAPEDVQSDIDRAKTAADEAQKDIDALAVRVTSAETKVTQNSEQILLMAKKTDVAKTLDGYYNKEQTDAQIDLKSSEIKLAVSSEVDTKINNIAIGGRNLVPYSETVGIYYCAYGDNTIHTVAKNGQTYHVNGKVITNPYQVSFVSGGSGDMRFGRVHNANGTASGDATYPNRFDLSNKTYTMSVWVMASVNCKLNSFVTRQYQDSDGSALTHSLTANKWTRITHSRTFSSRADLDGIRVRFTCGTTANIVFCMGKVELGNKATDWTPAPEDQEAKTQAVADNLANNYYTKKETKAEITVKTDSVKQEVAAIYQTKNDMENYSTTTQMNAAIETKANSITSSVSSTYATKTENQNAVDKANNAKTAADAAQATADGIQVGGRNLIMNSNVSYSRDKNATNVGSFSGLKFSSDTDLQSLIGKPVTLSLYLDTPGDYVPLEGQSTTMASRFGIHCTVIWSDSTGVNTDTKTQYPFGSKTLLGYGKNKTRVSDTWTVKPPTGYDTIISWRFSSQFYAKPASTNNAVWVCEKPKLEIGNKATEWTPAPEDIASDISEIGGNASDAVKRITVAESMIQQLSDSISSLVTDANGTSLMTQTSTGWTFSTVNIQNSVNSVANNLGVLHNSLGSTQSTVTALQRTVNDLENTAEYVRINTYESEPCIELGEKDSNFKLMITNTRIMFFNGSSIPTYITNTGLTTDNIIINNELNHAGFVWIKRANGNYSLIWKG